MHKLLVLFSVGLSFLVVFGTLNSNNFAEAASCTCTCQSAGEGNGVGHPIDEPDLGPNGHGPHPVSIYPPESRPEGTGSGPWTDDGNGPPDPEGTQNGPPPEYENPGGAGAADAEKRKKKRERIKAFERILKKYV